MDRKQIHAFLSVYHGGGGKTLDVGVIFGIPAIQKTDLSFAFSIMSDMDSTLLSIMNGRTWIS